MSKRYMCCGGDFCAMNLGLNANPCHTIVGEIGCCNGKGKNGYGWSTTAYEIAEASGKRFDGKAVIVTGANSGIGRDSARVFYQLGATVIMACRSAERAEKAKHWIQESATGKDTCGKLIVMSLNLSNLKSVKAFTDEFLANIKEPLAILLCNAGIMATPFTLTDDGYELQFQSNYLAHYYLQMLLMDRLKESAAARIVNVSSIAEIMAPANGVPCFTCCFGGFDMDKRWPAKGSGCIEYDPMEDYGYSKAAQIIFSSELDRRLLNGTQVTSVSVHPGVILHGSNLINGSGCFHCMAPIMGCAMTPMLKTTAQGAATSIYAALGDDVKSGEYYKNCNPTPKGPYTADPKNKYGPLLWAKSSQFVEAKVGVKVPHADIGGGAPATLVLDRDARPVPSLGSERLGSVLSE